MKNVGINGFGRIGRSLLRAILQDPEARNNIDIRAINIGPANPESVAHMFKYDTIMGTFPEEVSMENNTLKIGNTKIKIISELKPEDIPWKDLGVDVVAECSGHFTDAQKAAGHLKSGAKYIVISAPAKNEDVTIIPGVNDEIFDKNKHKIIALGSCTTNALLPMLKVLDDAFGIKKGLMTTIHAYTNSQVLLDVEHKDLRRARAAALNIIPTTTGAMKVAGKVMPHLADKLEGLAIRVPVGIVSIVDLVVELEKSATKESINKAFDEASKSQKLKGIVCTTNEPLVSSDFKGTNCSVIIDKQLTSALGNTAKVFGWYDNEYGYATRLRDFILRDI